MTIIFKFIDRAIPNLVVFLSGLAIMVLELVASRVTAKHIGASLDTWTAVIGIILAGMSFGNNVGGRLSDRFSPQFLLYKLFWLAGLLCGVTLLLNDAVGPLLQASGLPSVVRTVTHVSVVFLAPAFVLGMIPPVVARWAVERFSGVGAAIGNVYAWGTAGNILGTFLTGYVLLARFPVSRIVMGSALLLGLTGCLVWYLARLGTLGPKSLDSTEDKPSGKPAEMGKHKVTGQPRRMDLVMPIVYVFATGMAIMMVEMVGSRFLSRYLGTSIYTWTSLIGVVLAGITVGNMLGGLLADSVDPEKALPRCFMIASIMVASIMWTHLLLEIPDYPPHPVDTEGQKLEDPGFVYSCELKLYEFRDKLVEMPLPRRCFVSVILVFFFPSLAMGMISPCVAKIALQRSEQTGRTIGNVYAWGAIGSIVGTFLAGYVMISAFGPYSIISVTALALGLISVTMAKGDLSQAVWAGMVLAGACVSLAPDSERMVWVQKFGQNYGLRPGELPDTYIRHSNYYTIKVELLGTDDVDGEQQETIRELVLDNLIHGYVNKNDPLELRYEYELIYQSIMEHAGAIPQNKQLDTLFIGGGSYTYPRYIEAAYPGSDMLVMEIDPKVTEANHEVLFLDRNTPIETRWGDARATVDQLISESRSRASKRRFDFVFGDAFNDFSVPWHLTTLEFNEKIRDLLTPDGVYMINIIDNYRYSKFLGAYLKTAQKTFKSVGVFATEAREVDWEEDEDDPNSKPPLPEPPLYRETFVIAMSMNDIDWSTIGQGDDERSFVGMVFRNEHIERAIELADHITLTDDFAPVDNLLSKVARDR